MKVNVEVVSGVKVPKSIEVKKMKASVTYTSETKKCCLKGTILELSHPTSNLKNRTRLVSEEFVKSCHMGKMKGYIAGIKTKDDLQEVLNKYFKLEKGVRRSPSQKTLTLKRKVILKKTKKA
jgi:hypothetical protein